MLTCRFFCSTFFYLGRKSRARIQMGILFKICGFLCVIGFLLVEAAMLISTFLSEDFVHVIGVVGALMVVDGLLLFLFSVWREEL